MHLPASRPQAQPFGVALDNPLQKGPELRMLDARETCLELRPHLVEGSR
jgi:hypothetical protein